MVNHVQEVWSFGDSRFPDVEGVRSMCVEAQGS